MLQMLFYPPGMQEWIKHMCIHRPFPLRGYSPVSELDVNLSIAQGKSQLCQGLGRKGTEHSEGLTEARSLRKASLGKAFFGLKSQLSGQKRQGKARQAGTGIQQLWELEQVP